MGTKRVEGKKKKKSIKAKVTSSMGSKRRLAKFGKQMKKGHKGEAAHYYTRSKCLKKLQITLKDFRRLCILKGIYPRDPKKKTNGKDKVYYHVKDISYLSHEPLLEKFREFKAFMKKIRRAAGRKEYTEAQRMDKLKPTFTVDHLVKERYPQFVDALGDLDDALCMIHLFAALPAEGRIRVERTENCLKLCREWQNYIALSNSLTKTFVSIKGIYYQANVMGQDITWLVPHAFPQTLPKGVDYRVMMTFLEFYESLMKFVNFKLYHDLGVAYPPKIDLQLDEAGAKLAAVKMEARSSKASNKAEGVDAEDNEDAEVGTDSEDPANAAPKATKKTKKLLKSLSNKLKSLDDIDGVEDDEDSDADGDEEAAKDSLMEPLEAAFASNQDAQLIHAQIARMETGSKLFKGLILFLSREVPLGSLEFVIRSLDGQVGWDGPGSPFEAHDERITHQIADRPVVGHRYFTREYVQPQWVFDCLNNGILLPISLYEVGNELPPHLSPFVDDAKEGYVPEYRKKIEKIKAELSGVPTVADETVDDIPSEKSDSEDDDEEEEEEEEEDEEEAEKESVSEGSDAASGDEDEEEEEAPAPKKQQKSSKEDVKAAKKKQQADEEHEMRVNMMNKKAKRLYSRMQHGLQKKAEGIAKLEQKRQIAEDAKKKQQKKQKTGK